MYTSLTKNLNTVANATNAFTFAKADRFRSPAVNKPDQVKFRMMATTFGKRSTSFGYGNQHEIYVPRGKESPSPDTYRTTHSVFD